MTTVPENEGDPISYLCGLLLRDQRNLLILRADAEADRRPIPACDCADLIEFLHILDIRARQPDAYVEAIRRYFVKSDKVLLLPSWTYELLNYMRRVVHNIGKFGQPGGFEAFLSKYPVAARFRELWESRQYIEAEKVYAQHDAWVQILSFTHDENVQDLLGRTIRQFNALVDAGKFLQTPSVTDPVSARLESDVYETTLTHLRTLRPQSAEQLKNEMDARSLAKVFALNRAGDNCYTAITAAKHPLKAFYQAIDEVNVPRIPHYEPLSFARSPITEWIAELADAVAGTRCAAYLDRGLGLVSRMLELAGQLDESILAARERTHDEPEPVLSAIVQQSFETRGLLVGLLEAYNSYYRDRIFRPIEAAGSKQHRVRHETMEIEKGADAMQGDKFEGRMKQARQSLQGDVQRMLQRVEPFVTADGSVRVSGKPMHELFKALVADFERDVY